MLPMRLVESGHTDGAGQVTAVKGMDEADACEERYFRSYSSVKS